MYQFNVESNRDYNLIYFINLILEKLDFNSIAKLSYVKK